MLVNALRLTLAGTVAASAIAAITHVVPARADMVIARCLSNIDYTVSDFTGAPSGVRGTVVMFACLSVTHPQISSATATTVGTAQGTEWDVTINEVDHITWRDAAGRPVATSTAQMTRQMVGPPILMVATGYGLVVGGLMADQKITVIAGHATRETNPDGTTSYHNQSENDVDYG